MSMLFLRACLVGAQELYKLCEDSTSPIGSRAAKRFVPNLRSEALSEIIRSYQPSIDERALRERTALLYHQTGGHGGLSAALARRFVELPDASANDLAPIVESVRLERSELFQMWIHNFSAEARTAGDTLMISGHMTIEDVAACLRSGALPPYRADRVSEELQFTGVAVAEGDQLLSVNAMYNETARKDLVGERGAGRADEQKVWS